MSEKPKLTGEEEALFFWHLGYRLFSSVLRGYVAGHKRPLSAARDYLHFTSLDGIDREASEFLVDVAKMGRVGSLSLEELHDKWKSFANWRPDLDAAAAEHRRRVDEGDL